MTVVFTFTDLGSDILVIEHLLDHTLCSHLIQVAECCQFEVAGIEVGRKDTQIRDNGLLYLDGEQNALFRSTNQLLIDKIGIIQHLLLDHYGIRFPHAETCSILRYQPGQAYKRHVDNLLLSSRLEEVAQGIPTRDVSIVGYLNHDFEGGETYFDRQQLTVEPQMGHVLVFPAYYTHPHQSLPVISGCKYAFTSWLFH
jgi:prolyl 4-hydroxylase